jgi:hypothetical protein
VRFLALIAEQSPTECDAWAVGWLDRWLQETSNATTDRAAEIAGVLADLLKGDLDALAELIG